MKYGTLGIGVAFTALSLVLIGTMASDPMMTGDMGAPRRMTYIFLGLLGAFGLLLMHSGWKELQQKKSDAQERDDPQKQAVRKRFWVFVGLCVAYALTLSTVGFFLPSTFFLLFFSLILQRIRVVNAVIISLIFSLTVFIIFKSLLGVPLP